MAVIREGEVFGQTYNPLPLLTQVVTATDGEEGLQRHCLLPNSFM